MLEGDCDLNDAIAHALKTQQLPERGNHSLPSEARSQREIRGAYMDMDPSLHGPDHKPRSNASPSRWRHTELPPHPIYPSRGSRPHPYIPPPAPRHSDVRRVCHEPRRPPQSNFAFHHRQVETYPQNEAYFRPPSPPFPPNPPPRYPNPVLNHFEKLHPDDLRHQAGYRNYSRPESSHHYRAASPTRVSPRTRSPPVEDWHKREYLPTRRRRNSRKQARVHVEYNDSEYESFDRLLKQYKSLQRDVLPTVEDMEASTEKQNIARAIRNRIVGMQPATENTAKQRDEVQIKSNQDETVEIDGKQIPISVIQNALRSAFQQASLTAPPEESSSKDDEQEKKTSENLPEAVEENDQAKDLSDAGNLEQNPPSDIDNCQNDDILKSSLPDVAPVPEDPFLRESPISPKAEEEEKEVGSSETKPDVTPTVPAAEQNNVPISTKQNEQTDENENLTSVSETNSTPDVKNLEEDASEDVLIIDEDDQPQQEEEEETVSNPEANDEEHPDSEEDEELLKLRYVALTSAFQRNVVDIVQNVTDNKENGKAVENQPKGVKGKKKKAKPKGKRSVKLPTFAARKSKSRSQSLERNQVKDKTPSYPILRTMPSSSKDFHLPKIKERSLSPLKDMRDPKVLTLGAELQRRKAQQKKVMLQTIRKINDNKAGGRDIIKVDEKQQNEDKEKIPQPQTEDNFEVVEMDTTDVEISEIIIHPQQEVVSGPQTPQPCPPGTEADCTPSQESIWDLLEENVKNSPIKASKTPEKATTATPKTSVVPRLENIAKIDINLPVLPENNEEFSHAFDSPRPIDDMANNLISQYVPVEMLSRNESPALLEEDTHLQENDPEMSNEETHPNGEKSTERRISMEDPEDLRNALLQEIAEKRSAALMSQAPTAPVSDDPSKFRVFPLSPTPSILMESPPTPKVTKPNMKLTPAQKRTRNRKKRRSQKMKKSLLLPHRSILHAPDAGRSCQEPLMQQKQLSSTKAQPIAINPEKIEVITSNTTVTATTSVPVQFLNEKHLKLELKKLPDVNTLSQAKTTTTWAKQQAQNFELKTLMTQMSDPMKKINWNQKIKPKQNSTQKIVAKKVKTREKLPTTKYSTRYQLSKINRPSPPPASSVFSAPSSLDPKLHPRHKPVVINICSSSDEEELPKLKNPPQSHPSSVVGSLRSKVPSHQGMPQKTRLGKISLVKDLKSDLKTQDVEKGLKTDADVVIIDSQTAKVENEKASEDKKLENEEKPNSTKDSESVEVKLHLVRELVQRDKAHVSKLTCQQKEKQSRISLLKNRFSTLKAQLEECERKLSTEKVLCTKLNAQVDKVTNKMNQRLKLEAKFVKQLEEKKKASTPVVLETEHEMAVESAGNSVVLCNSTGAEKNKQEPDKIETELVEKCTKPVENLLKPVKNSSKPVENPSKLVQNSSKPVGLENENQFKQIRTRSGQGCHNNAKLPNKEHCFNTLNQSKPDQTSINSQPSQATDPTHMGDDHEPYNKAYFDISRILKAARQQTDQLNVGSSTQTNTVTASTKDETKPISSKTESQGKPENTTSKSKKVQLMQEKAKLLQKARELKVQHEKVKLKHTKQKLRLIKQKQSKSNNKALARASSPAMTKANSISPQKPTSPYTEANVIIELPNHSKVSTVKAISAQMTLTDTKSNLAQAVAIENLKEPIKRKITEVYTEKMDVTLTQSEVELKDKISPPVTPTLKKARSGRKDSTSSLIGIEGETRSIKMPKLDSSALNKLQLTLVSPKVTSTHAFGTECGNNRLLPLFQVPACFAKWIYTDSEIVALTSTPRSTDTSNDLYQATSENPGSRLTYFRSHRLSPSLRTNKNISITSLTFSHKINPHQVLCRYDLTGKCNDKKCKAQHWADIVPTANEIYLDLLSYCPSLLKKSDGSSVSSSDSREVLLKAAEDSVHRLCGSEISVSGRPIMSTEETSILLISIINRALGSKQPHTITFNRRSSQLWQISNNMNKEESDISPFSWNDLNTEIWIPESENTELRYFDQEDAKNEIENLKSLLNSEPNDDEVRIQLSELYYTEYKLSKQSNMHSLDMALHTLCLGIELNEHSEALWSSYLPLLFTHNQQSNGSLDNVLEMMEQVMIILPLSKPVWSQILKWNWSYQKLDALYQQLIGNLIKRETVWKDKENQNSENFSFYSCWLMVTVVERCHAALLSQGPLEAKKSFMLTLKELSEMRSNSSEQVFPISSVHLSKLWLVYIYLTEYGNLPSSIYDDSLSDIRYGIILSEREVILNFPSARKLNQKPEKLRAQFKAALLACTDPSESAWVNATHCMQLYKSLLELETSLKRWPAINTMCRRLIENLTMTDGSNEADIPLKQTSVDHVWIMWAEAILQSKNPVMITQTFDRAITAAPHNAKLAFTAALYQLNSESRDIEAALLYLETCLGYYLDLEDMDSLLASELHQLYRNLLKHDAMLRPNVGGYKPRSLSTDQLELHKGYFWLSYCMLTDLVINEQLCAPEKPIKQCNIFDLYEAALHDVIDLEHKKEIWIRYLLHFRSQPPSLCSSSSDRPDPPLRFQWLKRLMALVKRCLFSVPCKAKLSHNALQSENRTVTYFTDYSFHNQVASIFLGCFPPQQLSVALTILTDVMPTNIPLVLRSAEELLRTEDHSSILSLTWGLTTGARSGICYNPTVWKITTAALVGMGKYKKALQVYQRSLLALKHCKALWRDVAAVAMVLQNHTLLNEIDHASVCKLEQGVLDLLKNELAKT
uniref:uncharacterized protein LOC100182384 isoform X3 n=1 Tax=Ciona intestinalis TaxID=7719 RepID=UPI000180CA38|nr:uncharacterized protein LOC100182384 isoform X3 [Ciona intestinalis]|eukprot:XP_002123610.1 uncharacterized protein LOC100182384 isoform X3 [Ciona intestinalis]